MSETIVGRAVPSTAANYRCQCGLPQGHAEACISAEAWSNRQRADAWGAPFVPAREQHPRTANEQLADLARRVDTLEAEVRMLRREEQQRLLAHL